MTESRPKCLTPLAGRTLLEWQIASLHNAGIERIAAVGGYRAEMLQNPSLQAFVNPRWSETNMVMSLVSASAWLETAPCIVSYSDIVYHPDAIRALMKVEAEITISYDTQWQELWTTRFADPLADAETFRLREGGQVVSEIGQRAASLEEIQGQYMGLLKFTPVGWNLVRSVVERMPPEDRDKCDMTTLLKISIAQGVEIHAAPVGGKWCEVDNEADLRIYEKRIQAGASWAHDWRWEAGI